MALMYNSQGIFHKRITSCNSAKLQGKIFSEKIPLFRAAPSCATLSHDPEKPAKGHPERHMSQGKRMCLYVTLNRDSYCLS